MNWLQATDYLLHVVRSRRASELTTQEIPSPTEVQADKGHREKTRFKPTNKDDDYCESIPRAAVEGCEGGRRAEQRPMNELRHPDTRHTTTL